LRSTAYIHVVSIGCRHGGVGRNDWVKATVWYAPAGLRLGGTRWGGKAHPFDSRSGLRCGCGAPAARCCRRRRQPPPDGIRLWPRYGVGGAEAAVPRRAAAGAAGGRSGGARQARHPTPRSNVRDTRRARSILQWAAARDKRQASCALALAQRSAVTGFGVSPFREFGFRVQVPGCQAARV
jgi:hypothetical protein